MPTTVPTGFIYPDNNSEASINVAVAALAGSVEAKVGPYVVDTGWVDITVKAPFKQQGGSAPQVRRIGKTVYMRWGWSNAGMSANSVHAVGTVPAGFRPSQTAYVPGNSSGATQGAGVRGIFFSNGDIQITTSAALGGYYVFTTCWLID